MRRTPSKESQNGGCWNNGLYAPSPMVKAALAERVAKKLIVERKDKTGRSYYRLNKNKN